MDFGIFYEIQVDSPLKHRHQRMLLPPLSNHQQFVRIKF